MDPVLTTLADDQPRASAAVSARADGSLSSRALAAALASLAGLLGASLAIGALGAGAATPSLVAAAVLVVMYVVLRQVPFELGGVRTTSAQLVVVPLWFAVAPALLPLVLLGAEVVARAVELRRGGGRETHDGPGTSAHLLGSTAAAWPLVGPALVFSVAAPGTPAMQDSPIFLAALVAQLALGGAAQLLGPLVLSGASSLSLSFGARVRQLRPSFLLDAALAPVGVVAAVAMVDSVWMLLCVVPLGGLLGHFSKERDERLVKATELSHAYRGTAQLMGDVLEADDAYTGGEHTEGVVELSLGVGRELGLDDNAMRNLEFGALLHDIGKLRVPNEIINKPGKLNDEEWAIIKQHPGFGGEMLDRVGGALSEASPIVRAHHERWDGNGYPDRLAGEAIPIEARIITACDSFSAMTTNRSYRRAMTHHEAIEELERCSGSQFDPSVVAALRAFVASQAGPEVGSPLSAVPAEASPPTDSAAIPAPTSGSADEAQAA